MTDAYLAGILWILLWFYGSYLHEHGYRWFPILLWVAGALVVLSRFFTFYKGGRLYEMLFG